jgi:hypothetical protein
MIYLSSNFVKSTSARSELQGNDPKSKKKRGFPGLDILFGMTEA